MKNKMNIDYIINTFKDWGYKVKEKEVVDLAYGLRQTMIQKLPKDQVKERYDKIWTIHYNDDMRNYFSIFENHDVNSNGVNYYDPNHFHYFYSVDGISSSHKIYHENDLDKLYNDLINDLKSVLGKSDLRQLKLNSIGI